VSLKPLKPFFDRSFNELALGDVLAAGSNIKSFICLAPKSEHDAKLFASLWTTAWTFLEHVHIE
jgi:hypothetical protein